MHKSASQLDLRATCTTSLYPRSYSSGINFQVVNGRVIKVGECKKQSKINKIGMDMERVNQDTIDSLKAELKELKNLLNQKILKRKRRKLDDKRKVQENSTRHIHRTIVLLYPQYIPRNETTKKKRRPVSMYL